MQFLVIDFETFYDKRDYTLRKMTTEAYIRDPRFEVHGAAVWFPKQQKTPVWFSRQWFDRDAYDGLINGIDWPNTAVIAHHAHFDVGVLSLRYGIKPGLVIDTLSMARALVGNHIKAGLESLMEHFGLPPKNVPYDLFDGEHWHELTGPVRDQIAAGSIHDCASTWDIFCRLSRQFPASEYALVDSTVRMFTEPVLVGNTDKLAAIGAAEQAERDALLAALDASGTDIRSNETFAELLRAEGVEPGTKPGKNGEIYAFAKTDQFMRGLQEDGEPRVQALVQARLAEKSNIIQTRSSRLLAMSERGPMCVYLAPFAAHTTRWGGGDKTNWQNFPRESTLGECIEAPEGWRNIIVDASQIECRLLNYVAGQWDVIERFARKEDPYIGIASQFYGEPIYKPKVGDPRYSEMEQKRGTGKQLELSCGYGAGGPTIQATAAKGTYGPPVQISLSEALRARDLYRDTHPAVVALWEASDVVLKNIANGFDFDFSVFKMRNRRLYLPNGCFINYESLHWYNPADDSLEEQNKKGWRLVTRKGSVKMYGAKLAENFIQALSRVHIGEAWLKCLAVGVKIVSMEHDKLIACVPVGQAQTVLETMQEIMRRPPAWAPGLPLDSEGYISRTFKREK